jgi:DNA-binding NtrC family response regulator
MRQVDLSVLEDARPESPSLLLGESPVIDGLREEIRTAARCEAKVLVTGETGVGKEVVARLIHQGGTRRLQPFLAINCAGLPDSLLESELFGHVRGSFTDAYRDKPGLAALADRGTLFLDELGEMSPRMQTVLLRFLETGEIHRLGSDRIEQRVDVRIIAATNRNLSERIANGQFREDLYYRLNVTTVSVPPLRERGRDVLLLFAHYFSHYCRKSGVKAPMLLPSTEERLLNYPWPGNVRELKNVAERLAVRHDGDPIGPEMLPMELRSAAATGLRPSGDAGQPPRASVAADAVWDRMMLNKESFWATVHPLFINRELTKADVREIIRRGLTETHGNFRSLTTLFHLPASDYKRFLAFLRQHDCHIAAHTFKRNHRPLERGN